VIAHSLRRTELSWRGVGNFALRDNCGSHTLLDNSRRRVAGPSPGAHAASLRTEPCRVLMPYA
jgi:hypothetical protein